MQRHPAWGLALLLAATLLTAQCTPRAAQTPTVELKVAAIFPGVVTDADYNALGYVALQEVAKEQGVQIAHSERVAVPDVERVMREYVDQGFNVIWTHGGQFISQTQKLAEEFPNVYFIGETDAPVEGAPPNLWIIDRNFQVGFYAIGALAARLTQTGRVGYIGGLALPFSYAEVHAMRQAIRDAGLNVDLRTVWAGDFNDPTKARQVADALIADGVDVLVGSLNLGMLGVFEAAKAAPRRVWVTAKYTDKSEFAPDQYVTSVLYDFAGPLRAILDRIRAGETGGYYPLGFDTGVALQFPLRNAPPELEEQMRRISGELEAGRIQVTKDSTPIR
ncbi:MAG: BMP family protein [Armatimonadota bacterium]|nr:BMP family protein [Armatimonadota bacterium]MDR5696219.1 BMP family protein [Armatimonadota bacterium]